MVLEKMFPLVELVLLIMMCSNVMYAIVITLARTKERLRLYFLSPIIRLSLILFNVFNMHTNPGAMFCSLDKKDTEKMEDQLIIHGKAENYFESNAQPEFSPSCYLNCQTECSCF